MARMDSTGHVLEAYSLAPQDKDGAVRDDYAKKILRELVRRDFEIDKAIDRQVNREWAQAHHPSRIESPEQLFLPGMNPFPYEPDLLVSNEERTRSILLSRATPMYMWARSHRADENLGNVKLWADRWRTIARQFSEWYATERQRGRKEGLTLDNWIREQKVVRGDEDRPSDGQPPIQPAA